MKHFLLLIILYSAALISSGCKSIMSAGAETAYQPKAGDVAAMHRIYNFIKDAGHYFIATVDKDQPRVRPFGTIHIFEGKLYIQTGRKKNVAKQLLANGKVELCAMKGEEWLRVSGVLIDDRRVEAKASMLEEYPNLRAMYSEEDDNTMVLYFKPGTVSATIWSFKNPPVLLMF